VYESDVVGNVFSDLGASGFVAGNLWDSKDTPPASMTGPANVALHAGWSTSSKWHPDSDELFHALNTQRATDSDFSEGRGWYSRDRELTAGTKPWIMFDLEKRYTLETIRFSFPDDATNEMRSNFEVQVSNDRNFNDYKVIKTYTSPVDFTEETAVGDGEKYRYIRLQKTISEPFSLDAIWAMSNDRTPQGQKGAPADCVIANNYFTRVGQTLWSSLPIWIIWTKNFEVLHNEIYEAPYTGISIGWGWDNYATVPTSGDNKINYNRVDGCMRQAADGGPIYIFGKQYGTEIRGNYMSDAYIGSTGLYLDNGCTGVTAIDNIVMDTNMGCTVNSGTRENTVQNLWSGGAQYQLNSKEVNYVDEMRCFTYSNQPEAVTRIIAEAGLEDEWKWIEARVPDVKSVIVTGPDAFEAEEVRKDVGLMNNEKITKYVLESTRYLLKEAEGGYLPWHFDPNALLDVAYWYDAVESDENRAFDNKRHLEDFVNLKEALRAANDTVYHPSWEEMLTMCDEMLAAGTEKKWGGYPADAMAAFKKNYQAIKATNPQTRSDKAVAAGRLEKIYTELYNKGYTADVLSVNVIGAKTEIDSENKKITVKLPSGMNPADVLPEIVTSPGTKVATELSRLRYEKGSVVIPLFQESLRQYAFWTMDIVSAEITAEGSVISADAADWTGGSWNAPPVQVKGALSIFPWFQPTMLAQPMGSTVNFSLWASRADTLNGIGIVFCAQSPDLLYDVKEAKNSYYLAELKGQDLSLYKVVAGVKEKCATVRSIGFEYGAFNNFAVTITPEGDMDRIEIRSGNLLLIDTLITEPIGENGYFGILSQDVDVKVK